MAMGVLLLLLASCVEREMDPLLWAIDTKDAKGVQELLDQGADVNKMGQHDMVSSGLYDANPLRVAQDISSYEVCKVLIEHGADVNYVDQNGESILMCAVGGGDYDMAKLLIEHGADVHYEKPDGTNMITAAVAALYAGDTLKETTQNEIIGLLLAKKVSIQSSAFTEALKTEDHEIRLITLGYLFEQGKNKGVIGRSEIPQIFEDIYSDRNEKVYAFINRKKQFSRKDFSIIAACVAKNNVEALRAYCENGGDVNLTGGAYGMSLLMVGAYSNSVESVRYLLENGVDIDQESGSGWKAIHFAQRYENEEIVKLLKLWNY